jgi:RNA polymerase-binding transcription factor DksA
VSDLPEATVDTPGQATVDAPDDTADDTPEARAVAEERAAELAALRQVQRDLAAVDRALAAIDEGAYGTCAVCGAPLADEMLTDSPVATACPEHEGEHGGAEPATSAAAGSG